MTQMKRAIRNHKYVYNSNCLLFFCMYHIYLFLYIILLVLIFIETWREWAQLPTSTEEKFLVIKYPSLLCLDFTANKC